MFIIIIVFFLLLFSSHSSSFCYSPITSVTVSTCLSSLYASLVCMCVSVVFPCSPCVHHATLFNKNEYISWWCVCLLSIGYLYTVQYGVQWWWLIFSFQGFCLQSIVVFFYCFSLEDLTLCFLMLTSFFEFCGEPADLCV